MWVSALAMAVGARCGVRERRVHVKRRTLLVLAVLLSVAQMIQYWMHIIPFSDTTWAQYRALFLQFR